MEAVVSIQLRNASTAGASISAACSPTNHAHTYAAKFWATKNFAAYGLRGTWSSIR
jgi:hypothetical protein